MAFFDYDRDGFLDIYVNVALELGIATIGQWVGVIATDLDNNGWPDIFTGNRNFNLNRLYLNVEGRFSDITVAAGIDQIGLGMGIHSFDYDNDLDFDLYWTAWPGSGTPQYNTLYQNVDGSTFRDVTDISGTQDPLGWGISSNAGDINNDGWEDFFVTNGFDASTTQNVLFLNGSSPEFVG